MALIPEAVASPTGTPTAARLPVNGDTIANCSERTFLTLINPSGGAIGYTVVGKRTCSQGGLHDATGSVAAGSTEVIGPIDSRFADPLTGLATVNYTGTLTGSTVYVTRV
jgi:hypothetical protein